MKEKQQEAIAYPRSLNDNTGKSVTTLHSKTGHGPPEYLRKAIKNQKRAETS